MRKATIEDKELVESICNHPEIRKWTACNGAPPMNADKYFHSLSFAYLVDGGVFLMVHVGSGKYVVHTNLLPSLRGKEALRVTKKAIEFAFIGTDCNELLTMVPVNNPQAKWFAEACGFKYKFTRKDIWPVRAIKHDMEFFKLDINDWILQGHNKKRGIEFHDELHKLTNKENHVEDPVHDCYVGSTVEMLLHGQVDKALHFYNLWARFALYAPIKLVSKDPLKIDIQSHIIQVENGKFSVTEN